MKIHPLLLFVVLIGCASAPPDASQKATLPTPTTISRYYTAVGTGSSSKADPQFVRSSSSTDAQAIVDGYLAKGYHTVGYTSFWQTPGSDGEVPTQSLDAILEQARRVGAEVAVYRDYPDGTETVDRPRLDSFTTGVNATNYYSVVPVEVQKTSFQIDFLAR
jgi:hypothetical protein